MELREKLFTEKQIGISAFLGGPIAPGILIYKNLIRLNKEKEAYISIVITLVFTVLLVYSLILMPESFFDKIPAQLFPAIIGLFSWALYHILLAQLVSEKIQSGKTLKESNWRVAGAIISGTILLLSIGYVIVISQPPFPGDKLTYKGNEIYFDDNTSSEDVKKLADNLFTIDYFSEEFQNVAMLETWKTRYIVTLPISSDYWNDEVIISDLTSLKWLLEVEFKRDVTVRLEDYKLNGDRITKTL